LDKIWILFRFNWDWLSGFEIANRLYLSQNLPQQKRELMKTAASFRTERKFHKAGEQLKSRLLSAQT
jgi:hypothetical protein